MTSVTLLHLQGTFKIPASRATTKCTLFQTNPALLGSTYRVQSLVSLSIFREFLSALDGNSITITNTNFSELQQLSHEFGFSELAAQLSEFRPSADSDDSLGRIASLEEKSNQHSNFIAMLRNKVTSLSTDFDRLSMEISALRSASAGIQTPSEKVSPLKRQMTAIPSQTRSSLLFPQQLPVGSIDSRIISGFPEIFADFRGKRFEILWRGSRDGFKAKEFHVRCDGHVNTLTVILDTNGNIFGGFTPLKWESDDCNRILDDSRKNFLLFE
jgi:hypothetical protein